MKNSKIISDAFFLLRAFPPQILPFDFNQDYIRTYEYNVQAVAFDFVVHYSRMNTKKKKNKKEVYFIATKYKNRPVDVTFYTKTGEEVEREAVERTYTSEGVKFYAAV